MFQFEFRLSARSGQSARTAKSARSQTVLGQAGVPAWLPSTMLLREADIAQNWDVTSDSLSAWLAKKIEAWALMLVKETTVASKAVHAAQLAERNIVDREFPQFAAAGACNTAIASR